MANGQNAICLGSIFPDDNRDHAVELCSAGRVDAVNARMGIWRMQNFTDQHSRQAEIVSIFAGAGSLFRGVDHRGRLADDGESVIHLSSVATPFQFVVPSSSFLTKRGNLLSADAVPYLTEANPWRSAAIAARIASYIWL